MRKLALLLVVSAAVVAAADISGKWNFNLISFGEEIGHSNLELKVEGNKLSGTLGELKLEGILEGDTLKLIALRPDGEKFGELEGHLSGAELMGKTTRGSDDFEWTARRSVVVRATPQTHDFTPTQFHRFFPVPFRLHCI